jgi:hypothetical protein
MMPHLFACTTYAIFPHVHIKNLAIHEPCALCAVSASQFVPTSHGFICFPCVEVCVERTLATLKKPKRVPFFAQEQAA